LDNKLVTEQQISEALDYQKSNGGRLESHLYSFGYIDEDSLLKAIKIQYNCKTVNLSRIKIDKTILKMIPPGLAWLRILLPFDLDSGNGILKIACANPFFDEVKEELQKEIPGRDFELYAAVECILKCAVMDNYRSMMAYDLYHELKTDPKGFHNTESKSKIKIGPDMSATATFTGSLRPVDPETIKSPVIPSNTETDFYKKFEVLLYNAENEELISLKNQLLDQEYEIRQVNTIPRLAEEIENNCPDILLLKIRGNAASVITGIGQIFEKNITLDQLPTFVLADNNATDNLMELLNYGIEDVVSIDYLLDPLIVKLNRVRNRLNESVMQRLRMMKDLGTHGSLEDFNVIDLIQSMGASEKTASLNITAVGRHLTVYFEKGKIIFAECEDKTGADAIYIGIPWKKGVWSIDPVDSDNLPERNTFKSNEAILLEGCQLLDESRKIENDNIECSLDELDKLF
jgi:hypothetical protein